MTKTWIPVKNGVIEPIFILSNIADSVLKASNDNKDASFDHVNLVKSCIGTITFLHCVSTEFSSKRKNKLRSIVHTNFLTLCLPKPGTNIVKTKLKTPKSVFLLDKNIKQVTKDSRRSQEITKIDVKKDFEVTRTGESHKDQEKSFSDHSKKGGQNSNWVLMQRRLPSMATTTFPSSSKQ